MYFNMLATTVSISRKIFKFNIFSRYLIITQCAVLLSSAGCYSSCCGFARQIKTNCWSRLTSNLLLGEVILNCICRVVSGKPIKVFINLCNLLCNICMLINSINVGDLHLKCVVDVDLKID